MFEGSEETERLWEQHVGSRHMFSGEELTVLRRLSESRILPRREMYRLYLTSKWWRMLRKKALERDGHRCTECGNAGNLHVDHLRYPGYGKEKLEDVRTLCYRCHAAASKKFDVEAHYTVRKRKLDLSRGQIFAAFRGGRK